MDERAVADEWQAQGFVVLPGWIPAEDLAPALQELETVFPSASGFHDGTDRGRNRFLGDEFAGINTFPFASVELSLLAVNAHVVKLAELLLGDQDLRIYSAEAWAKYTNPPGTTSPPERRRSSSPSSDLRRPVTRTGPRTPSPASPSDTATST